MKRNRVNILYTMQPYSYVWIFAFSSNLIIHLILQSLEISATPTVIPYDKFDLEKDVDTIHQLVRQEPRYIPDVDGMVRMVCQRDRNQRLEMGQRFSEKYQERDIANYCAFSADGEVSFGDLIRDCFRSELGIYTDHLRWELTTMFKSLDKEAIVEILLSIPPIKKQEFLNAYHEIFKISLIEDANYNLEGDFSNIVAEMINRNRAPDISPDQIDWDLAKKEAQLLYDGREKWHDHRSELDRILMETSIQQLNATFIEFQTINNEEIEHVLNNHMEKDKRGTYKSMVFFVKNKHDYYARRIEKAMKGWGTQDHVINRIIAVHSEDDLHEIAIAFQLNTGDSLIQALESETTMHHEMLITCLAGKPILKECV